MWFPKIETEKKKRNVITCVQFARVTFTFTKITDSSHEKRPIKGRGMQEHSMENKMQNSS